jgi:hypothetical protein
MKQPLRIFIVTFEITVICVSFFVLILSKYLWGYYYKRPELDKRIYSFQVRIQVFETQSQSKFQN